MPKQVATKYYIKHTIVQDDEDVAAKPPLSSLADNQCPTYSQLIMTKNNGYPIKIRSDFFGDPIIDSNGYISTPVMSYTPNRLVSEEDVFYGQDDIDSMNNRINLEIVIQPQAAGGVVGYAAPGGKSVYFNSIYWNVVNKDGGPDYLLPCNIHLGQIAVAIKGTGNFAIVQNTRSATVLYAAERDGYLELHLHNPYAVSFPFPVTSKSDIIFANVPTLIPPSIRNPFAEYFFTVRLDSN